MTKPHTILQGKIEQLTSGVPLEVCLEGLPETEVELLRLVAGLQTVPHPPRDEKLAGLRRASFLEQAEATRQIPPVPGPAGSGFRSFFERLPVGAVPVVVAFVLLAGVGLSSLLGSGGSDEGGTTTVVPPGQEVLGPIPGLEFMAAPDAKTASLNYPRGLVQVRLPDGAWTVAEHGELLHSTTSVRTGGLSGATIALFDGSLIHLGPGSEIAVDNLDVPPAPAPRLVELTQLSGESDHQVTPSTVEGSRYVVNTPAGSGEATGTRFTVVTTTAFTRFDVSEGSVSVANLDVVVVVVAGQSTVIEAGGTPRPPLFTFSGQGEVIEIGTVWKIGGTSVLTDATTIVIGAPNNGDWVRFRGSILGDGTRLVDEIRLLRRSPSNSFELTGTADAIGAGAWTVGGTAITITDHTSVHGDISLGDLVSVAGRVGADGSLIADSIRREHEDEDDRHHFRFFGVVNSMGNVWVISGVPVAVNDETEIEDGIGFAAIVSVGGLVLADGTFVALEIELGELDDHGFAMVGTVQSMAPWTVAGIAFQTLPATDVDPGIEVGDLVQVKGVILPDGSWLAGEIELAAEELQRFTIVGEVESTNPWKVSGLTFGTDTSTDIDGTPQVGDRVVVAGRVLDNGTLIAERIRVLPDLDLGCTSSAGAVNSFTDTSITLHNFETIEFEDDLEIEGDLQIASVVLVQICVTDDGTVVVINIIVIFQLDELPVIIIHRGDDDDD